jgi:hypothetical protein
VEPLNWMVTNTNIRIKIIMRACARGAAPCEYVFVGKCFGKPPSQALGTIYRLVSPSLFLSLSRDLGDQTLKGNGGQEGWI